MKLVIVFSLAGGLLFGFGKSFKPQVNAELSICDCRSVESKKVVLQEADSRLNVRDSPSLNGKIVGKLAHDSEIVVCRTELDDQEEWIAVILGEQVAYVSSRYLARFEQQEVGFVRVPFLLPGAYELANSTHLYEIVDGRRLRLFSELPAQSDVLTDTIISLVGEAATVKWILISTDEEIDLNGSVYLDSLLLPGQTLSLTAIGFPDFSLSATGAITARGIKDYRLEIQNKGTDGSYLVWCQDLSLWQSPAVYEGGTRPSICGDFNKDGHPDLIYSVSYHYAGAIHFMLLSRGNSYERVYLGSLSSC